MSTLQMFLSWPISFMVMALKPKENNMHSPQLRKRDLSKSIRVFFLPPLNCCFICLYKVFTPEINCSFYWFPSAEELRDAVYHSMARVSSPNEGFCFIMRNRGKKCSFIRYEVRDECLIWTERGSQNLGGHQSLSGFSLCPERTC